MRARRFTAAGLLRFAALLDQSFEGRVQAELFGGPGESREPERLELLVSPALTEELSVAIELSPGPGATRLEAARSLDEKLRAARLAEPERDPGLWAWLAAFYLDALCPRDAKGRRKPGAKARYVPSLDESWKTYRHLLLGPYLVYVAHRDDPARALCLLCQPLSRPGMLVDRFASRPRLVACPAAVGVATHLFCEKAGGIRRGALSSVDRLCEVLLQLDRTYDLYGMTTDGLLRLLPREFDRFRRTTSRKG